MNYDSVIIGGGISGLISGLKCLSEGLSCAIISSGMSALHFTSGSIDLLGFYPEKNSVVNPFEDIDAFADANPDHPYGLCGRQIVEEAMFFMQDQVGRDGLELYARGMENHSTISPFGMLRPTFFSQKSMHSKKLDDAFYGKEKKKIVILNFAGFRDFHPAMTAANLKQNELFSDCEIVHGTIELPNVAGSQENPHEYRSIDICRILEEDGSLPIVAESIKKISKVDTFDGDALFVVLPACLGLSDFNRVYDELSRLTGAYIYEVSTLPPSIPGIRIDNALKNRFLELGGIYIAGGRVGGGRVVNNRLECVIREDFKGEEIVGKGYVLCTGSFFSKGLSASSSAIKEPILGLDLDCEMDRRAWTSKGFFSDKGHPFMNYGVKINKNLNPSREGETIENLYCSGAILSGYNPVLEGTGSGVAISTGYKAALNIIESLK